MIIIKNILTFIILSSFVFSSVALAQEKAAPKAVVKKETDGIKPKEIEVVIGLDKFIKLDFTPDSRVQVGNESVLTYQLIPVKKEITLKGLKVGKTSVTIRNPAGDVKARYEVNVTSNSLSKTVQEIRDFLKDVEGIEVGVKGGHVYVGGEIIVPNDMGKINIMLRKYESVIDLVEISPQTQLVIAQKMQREIQTQGYKDVTVRVVNKAYWLEGVVPKAQDIKKVQEVATAMLPDTVGSLGERTNQVASSTTRSILQNFVVSAGPQKQPVKIPKLIQVVAQFVELTKDYSRTFGFQWQPVLGGDGGNIQFGKTTDGGVTTKSNGTLSGTISNLFPKLESARNAGFARVIQSGMVITKNGEQAKISKQGKVVFQIGTGETSRPVEIQTGLDITVKPQILEGEKIDLGLNIGIGLAGSTQNSTINNQIETKLVVDSKQSAAVGGVVFNESRTAFDKNPPFGGPQIEEGTGTPLFNFLRSKVFTTSKSQFVIFVTPEILESASAKTKDIQKKFRSRRRF